MNVEIKNLNYLAISNLLVQLKADNDEIKVHILKQSN